MQITYEKLVVDENSLFHYQEFIQPRFTSPFHLHDEFELIVIIRSHGKLYYGNNVTNFSDGDMFLFAPGLPHCFYNTKGYENGGKMAHAAVIFFRRDFLGSHFFEKTEAAQLNQLVKKSESGVQIIDPGRSLIRRIVRINEKNNLEKAGEFLLILNEVAGRKCEMLLSGLNSMKITGLNDSKTVNNVFCYVAENFQKKITLEAASLVANMQKAAFCRYFKRKTKKTFSEFVNETRIMHSRKLLTETDKTAKEIAYECGYESSSYFNRQFRRSCNMTPNDFRRNFSQV